MERAVKEYEIHPSILLIKNKIGNQKSFKFEAKSVSDIEKEIKTISPQKATPPGNIPPKILKLSSYTIATKYCRNALIYHYQIASFLTN